MKTPHNKTKWEEEFDKKIAPNITEYGGVGYDAELEREIKQFIASLISDILDEFEGVVVSADDKMEYILGYLDNEVDELAAKNRWKMYFEEIRSALTKLREKYK